MAEYAKACRDELFLSTLSLRRATESRQLCARPTKDFYPRSPCGERPYRQGEKQAHQPFLSTLSLRRATVDTLILAGSMLFLSTLSLRRATHEKIQNARACLFLSTLSLRRATTSRQVPWKGTSISIHALLAESDSKSAQNSGALLRI